MINLALIYAVADDGYIGVTRNGQVGFPWPFRLKDDLARFKQLTIGHPVIMGRVTYESIPPKLRPLKDRLNIILSSTASYNDPGVIVVPSLPSAIEVLDNSEFVGIDSSTVFVAGGSRPYAEAMNSGLVSKIYETKVHGSWGGDTKLPPFDQSSWQEIKRTKHHEGTHTYIEYKLKL